MAWGAGADVIQISWILKANQEVVFLSGWKRQVDGHLRDGIMNKRYGWMDIDYRFIWSLCIAVHVSFFLFFLFGF